MSFLSLSKGDPAARDLLQRAISARYGLRPLPLESVRLGLIGHGRGPLGLPVNVIITYSFITGSQWRSDHIRKLFGLVIGRCGASFDGDAYYERNGKATTRSDDPRVVDGMRKRLWTEAASLLTPLTAPGVTIKALDDCTFQAILDSNPASVATIRLNPDHTVAAVEARCYHPNHRQELRLCIKPEGGLQTINGFIVPRQITYGWEDQPADTFAVSSAEANPQIPLSEFSMG
jgi:hypothetical protein